LSSELFLDPQFQHPLQLFAMRPNHLFDPVCVHGKQQAFFAEGTVQAKHP
jgi:hypothetical protein